ncbi:hypothetical protein BZG04_15490 [Salinivibrio kushneri]|nr:hypothetical protein BZG04_15490 [Salinivibrio kushneri]OOE53249.1 hypothetical protein BZG12_08805 [Salinivibrio kushneri]
MKATKHQDSESLAFLNVKTLDPLFDGKKDQRLEDTTIMIDRSPLRTHPRQSLMLLIGVFICGNHSRSY